MHPLAKKKTHGPNNKENEANLRRNAPDRTNPEARQVGNEKQTTNSLKQKHMQYTRILANKSCGRQLTCDVTNSNLDEN